MEFGVKNGKEKDDEVEDASEVSRSGSDDDDSNGEMGSIASDEAGA